MFFGLLGIIMYGLVSHQLVKTVFLTIIKADKIRVFYNVIKRVLKVSTPFEASRFPGRAPSRNRSDVIYS